MAPTVFHPAVFHVKRIPFVLILLLAAIFASGCVVSRSPVTGKKRAYGMSWAQERQLGQQADQQIIAQFGLYDDAELTQYVDRVGQRVVQNSHLRRPDTPEEFRNTPFTFRVLDSPVVNAFALPGGYVYVTRGLLSHLTNEAQLAVVLGHEVGHVAARHASQRAFEQQIGQLGLIGGAILGQEVLGLPAGNLLNLGSQAAQLLFLSYSRDDERESDRLGVEYAALSGYEAAEGSAFFNVLRRLGEQQGGGIPNWLSTHPDPGEREQTILQLASEWEGRANMEQVDQASLYNAIDGIVLGENPRQGFTENNTFYHPDLAFQFPVPQNFQVINQPTQVGMIASNQQAIMIFTLAQQSSARQAASAFAQQQGLTVVESGPATVNGLTAYYVVADAQTEQQQIRILSYFIEHGGRVNTFIGYTVAQNFANYRDQFLRTMRGFAPLRDSRILNIKPVRLQITRAPRTGTFQTLLPSQLPEGFSAEELAILNQVQLNTTIQQGTPLKLPVR